MMKGNINVISYDCYQQATEKQLAGLKWKENRVYYISEIHNEKIQDEDVGQEDNDRPHPTDGTVGHHVAPQSLGQTEGGEVGQFGGQPFNPAHRIGSQFKGGVEHQHQGGDE